MRVAVSVAALVAFAALAGCSGKGGGHDHLTATCPNGTTISAEDFEDHENLTLEGLKAKCPGAGTRTNTTASAPNVLPTLVLTVSDDGGNSTNVTMLNGNLTFSAEGSADPDGNITGIAVSVKDSNRTQTASLFDASTRSFKTATFKLDRAGVANVTVAMVDDRAGFVVEQSFVYVNQPIKGLSSGQLNFPNGAVEENPCDPEVDDPLLNAGMVKHPSLTVVAGVSYITAAVVSGDGKIGICSPETDADSYGALISDVGESVTTLPDTVFELPPATKNYSVGIFANAPGETIVVDAIVHYEPRPAA